MFTIQIRKKYNKSFYVNQYLNTAHSVVCKGYSFGTTALNSIETILQFSCLFSETIHTGKIDSTIFDKPYIIITAKQNDNSGLNILY